MAITNTRAVGASYNALRLALFRQWEGDHAGVMFDTANKPRPTIGIGFNLDQDGVLDRVYTAMGITDDTHRTQLSLILDNEQIRALPNGNNPGQRNYEMQQALNGYLAANPDAANKTTFTIGTDDWIPACAGMTPWEGRPPPLCGRDRR